ncbi:DUF4352 domain-containing protein [Amphibacillus sp. Q70]|uniref:DUF4352 domain-containing protein n=1 Tax=Amphibacillus sp. Q70 TaxID=3453416 RepID=UPI003F869F4B
MKKTLRFLFVSLAVLLVISGCSNGTSEADDIDDNDVEAPDDNETNDDKMVSSEDDGEDSDSNRDLLSLGETGTVETVLGNFEVTPTAVRFVEEMEESDPYQNPDNGTFIIVDATITNIDDDVIDIEEINSARLHNEDGSGGVPAYEFDSINFFVGDLEPGESEDGELLFDYSKSDAYQLSFGSAYLDSLSDEVRWLLEVDDGE